MANGPSFREQSKTIAHDCGDILPFPQKPSLREGSQWSAWSEGVTVGKNFDQEIDIPRE
jgi:hypothetical protein